jgi:signal transduction histidine kinase
VLALASAATGEPAAALAAAWAGRAALDAVYATSRAAAAERTRAAFEVARRQWALDQAEARGVALRAEVARQRTLVWFGALGAALATALLVLVLRAARLARQNAVLVAAQGVQAERLRIAREVHDTLLQGFTGVTLQMQVAVEQLVAADASRATLGRTSDAAAAFERVLGRADAVLAEARSAVWDLRAPGAAEPLPAALAALLDDLAALPPSAAGIPALPVGRLEVLGSARSLGEMRERELLRIAREAVANAVRHARAQVGDGHARVRAIGGAAARARRRRRVPAGRRSGARQPRDRRCAPPPRSLGARRHAGAGGRHWRHPHRRQRGWRGNHRDGVRTTRGGGRHECRRPERRAAPAAVA